MFLHCSDHYGGYYGASRLVFLQPLAQQMWPRIKSVTEPNGRNDFMDVK